MRKVEALLAFSHSDDGISPVLYKPGNYDVVDGPGNPDAGVMSAAAAKMAVAEGLATELEKVSEAKATDDPLDGDDEKGGSGPNGDGASSSAAAKAPETPTSDESDNPSSSSTEAGDSDPTPTSSTPATEPGGAVRKGKKPPKRSTD